jgi:hypothetical protein
MKKKTQNKYNINSSLDMMRVNCEVMLQKLEQKEQLLFHIRIRKENYQQDFDKMNNFVNMSLDQHPK